MYCPRCGNQPASDRVRFCPSCGFRLDGVVDLLLRDGIPAAPAYAPPVNTLPAGEPSPRKKGIRRGAKLLFTSLVMFLPLMFFSVEVANHPGPMVLPLTIFLAGVFWMLYHRLFSDDHAPVVRPPQPVQYIPQPQPTYLPPPQSVPAYRSPADPAPEPSVVEHTTRSLDRQ